MDMIGDPFLRMQLQQLYEDRRKRHAKIEIDGVVRRFADDYKSKVILQLPDVTVKLQELAKFVADNNSWTDKMPSRTILVR